MPSASRAASSAATPPRPARRCRTRARASSRACRCSWSHLMSRSTSMAPPWPPPMQIDAMPRLPPVRSSTFSRCSTMRAPDAPTGWPSAIAPPSTLSLLSSSVPSAAGSPSSVAAELVAGPCAQARDHLRCERFVDLPRVDVGQAESVTRQERRGSVNGAKPHLRRIERRPFAVGDPSLGHEAEALDCALRREHDPRSAVRHLRAVAGRDVAVLAIEEGPELRQVLGRRVLPHAVVGLVELALAVEDAARSRRRSGLRRCAASTRWWLRAAKASISARVIPKRNARFSAVWPISRPTIGSVRPFMRPMTGAR